jgi:hypothetical protein
MNPSSGRPWGRYPRRLRQRLAAGIIECQLMARLPLFARRYPDPQAALDEPKLARALAGVGRDEIAAAGPMLTGAIEAAVRESAEDVEGLDIGRWTTVLSDLLGASSYQSLHTEQNNVVELTQWAHAAVPRGSEGTFAEPNGQHRHFTGDGKLDE